MNNINKTYTFDLPDCIWNVTFKCTMKNSLNEIKSKLFPARDLNYSIDKFIHNKIVG